MRGWTLWLVIIGVVSIAGGASGKMVLRGTDSSLGLVIAGVVFVVLGVGLYVWDLKKKKAAAPADSETAKKTE